MDSNDRSDTLERCGEENSSATSREIQMCTISTDFPNDATINLSDLRVIDTQMTNVATPTSYSTERQDNRHSILLPYLFINRATSFILSPVTSQPLQISSRQLPASLSMLPQQPQSLFLQALSKLNESSINLTVINHLQSMYFSPKQSMGGIPVISKSAELSPPDSLISAPPSYSFVLRQIATRRRPRLMGTFIPSPSFVQHTPPPNYAAAFDIYIDNPMPPPPPRVYQFGFTPMPIVCPECGYTGLSLVTTKITVCTHLCAVILCVLCCWICAPLPYILRSCKDVYHYCRNCRIFLGMYCPTSSEQTYPLA